MMPIRLRRGTEAQWASANPILKYNEVGVESDTGKTKTGDGVTAWSSIAYDPDVPLPGVDPGDGINGWRALAVAPPITGTTPADGSITTAKLADGAVTPAKLSMAAAPPRYKTGAYYTPPGPRGTGAPALNVLSTVPFWVGRAQNFDRIGAEVTTAGAAGATLRLGIYADDGNGLPGALVVDAGTITSDSTGAKELTISQSLAAGWYHLAALVNTATATFRVITGNNYPVGAGSLASATASGGQAGHYTAGVTGALPASFTLTDRYGAPVLVTLRAA